MLMGPRAAPSSRPFLVALVVLRGQITVHLRPFGTNPVNDHQVSHLWPITTNCSRMKRRLVLGSENSQPDTAAVSLVQRSVRAAVTVAGRVNKQGPVSGTGAATVKVASVAPKPSHRAADVTTKRTAALPGGRLLETCCRFYISGGACEVTSAQRIKAKQNLFLRISY